MMRAIFLLAVLCGVAIPVSHGKDCGYGFKCGDNQTCCLLSHTSYGCCPYEKGVCCKDMRHCCPNGYTCDLEHSRCIPSFINLIMFNTDNDTHHHFYVSLTDAEITENTDKKTKVGVELGGGDETENTVDKSKLGVELGDGDKTENTDEKTKLGVELGGGDKDEERMFPDILVFWGWMGMSLELLILILAASAALGFGAFLALSIFKKFTKANQYQHI